MEISKKELSGRYTLITFAKDFLTSYLILIAIVSYLLQGVLDYALTFNY